MALPLLCLDPFESFKSYFSKYNFDFSLRFKISETGTHAGVIIFSDIGWTKVTIKLNQFYNTTSFNAAVRMSPFYGYRTRMDLAFKLAKDELFTLAGGICERFFY